jgi:hypothetical protein
MPILTVTCLSASPNANSENPFVKNSFVLMCGPMPIFIRWIAGQYDHISVRINGSQTGQDLQTIHVGTYGDPEW